MSSIPDRFAAMILCALAPLMAQDIPITEHTLSNGMRVLLVERHDEPSIACGWVARVGSADERPGITGIAHLFEHMMFKGTKIIGTIDSKHDEGLNLKQDQVMVEIRKEVDLLREKLRRGEIGSIEDPRVRSSHHQLLLDNLEELVKEQRSITVKDELNKIYKQFGATGINADTTQDRTFFHIEVPANKLELWAWLESDRILNAVFREFYSERSVVLEERRMRTDATPTGKLKETFNAMIWQAHPYSWPVIGWPSDITQVTRDQADYFFSTYYAANNISLVLVGDFNTGEALGLIEKYFCRIPANSRAKYSVTTLEPAQPAEQRLIASADATPGLMQAYKIIPAVHRDAAALEVLSSILSGRAGRLYKELVIRKRVAVRVGAEVSQQKFGGVFYVEGTPAPGQTPEDVESLVNQELDRLKTELITEQELQKVKNQVQAATWARMESSNSLRDQLAEAESYGTYKDFLEEPAKLQAISREDVRRVARQYLTTENRTTMVIHRKELK